MMYSPFTNIKEIAFSTSTGNITTLAKKSMVIANNVFGGLDVTSKTIGVDSKIDIWYRSVFEFNGAESRRDFAQAQIYAAGDIIKVTGSAEVMTGTLVIFEID